MKHVTIIPPTGWQRWWHWVWCHAYPRGLIIDGTLRCPVCGRDLTEG